MSNTDESKDDLSSAAVLGKSQGNPCAINMITYFVSPLTFVVFSLRYEQELEHMVSQFSQIERDAVIRILNSSP